MRMKKILALALALAMVMSMTAFAGFTDAAKIDDNYAESVAVLTGMKVIKGYEDGSFKPQGTITRAEVAAIIYRIATQDVKDAKAGLYAGLANFSDVKAADWFAGYVGYCANAGYIKGYPDGTFKPQGLVTGFEALAMILRALGYDAENEFTGITWTDKVAKAGTQAGILDELNADEKLAAAADRELVAQMAFSALNEATIVRYTPAFGYTKTATTLGDAFALAETEAYDAWGRPSYGYTYNTGDKKTMFAVEADATYITAVTECEIADDIDFSTSNIYDLYYNGCNVSKYNVQALDTVQTIGAQGTLVEVYGKDRIVVIDTYLAKVVKVTDCTYDFRGHLDDEATLTLNVYDKDNAYTQVVLSDDSNYSYVAGDMLLVNAYSDAYGIVKNGDKTKYVEIVDYADALVGAQTLLWWNKDQHTIEGTTYDDAKWLKLDQAGIDTSKHTWWFDQYGNVIGATDIATIYTYGIIENIQWINPVGANGYAQATVRYMDGTTETKIVNKIDGVTLKYAQEYAVVGGYISTNIKNNASLCGTDLYRITTKSNGSIEVEHVFTADAAGNKLPNEIKKADIKTGIAAIAGDKVCYTNSNTVYLIQVAGSSITYKYVTGYENMANYTVNDNVKVDYVDLDANGYADYVYVTGTPDSAKSSGLFYLTSDNVKVVLTSSGAVSYYELTGIVDGVAGTIKVKDAKQGNRNLIDLFDEVNRMYGVNYEDGKVVYVHNSGEEIANGGYVSNYTTNTAYDGLNITAWYNGKQAAGYATYDGFVLKVGSDRYNVVGLTPVVGAWAEDMSDKEIYVIYDRDYKIENAYVAKAVYVADVAETGSNGTVVSDWVVEADGYAYNEKALKVAAPAGATLKDLSVKYGGTVTAVYYTTDGNGIVTKRVLTDAEVTIDSLLTYGAEITLVNHKIWTVID